MATRTRFEPLVDAVPGTDPFNPAETESRYRSSRNKLKSRCGDGERVIVDVGLLDYLVPLSGGRSPARASSLTTCAVEAYRLFRCRG